MTPSAEIEPGTQPAGGRRDTAIAALLVGCAVVVGFWEIMAHRSRQPFSPFELTAEDFDRFAPASRTWFIARIPIAPDPIEPNILAYSLRYRYPSANTQTGPVTVRLVHGYNVRDCMRIKGYRVDLIDDFRQSGLGETNAAAPYANLDGRVQIWRLTSDIGDTNVWITSMLRSWDFSETDLDTRSLPFPRVNVPDAQGWAPSGISLRSFQRPIHNFRVFLRAKWNGSRNDLATFLRLRQPAWASDDVLTLVSAAQDRVAEEETESALVAHALDAHLSLLAQLGQWRRTNATDASHPAGNKP